ncbi:MAG TPA: hypothetical protein VIX58_04635 [Anaerolineae bacterium]
MLRTILALLVFALLIAGFVALSLFVRDLFTTRAAVTPPPTLALVPAPTLRASETPASSPTATPTQTPTLTPTLSPTATSTPTETPTSTPTATPVIRAYVIPFRQVIGLNENNPRPIGRVWLYEGSNDVFQVLQRVPPSAQLQSLDGSAKFWVSEDALLAELPPAPVYDFSVRGKRATTRAANPFACSYNSSPRLAFGICANLSNVNVVTLIAAITADVRRFYQIEFGGQQFIVNAADIANIIEGTPGP